MESGPRNGAQLYLGRMRRRLIVLTLGLALVAAQADPAAAATNVRALNNYFQVSRITIQVDQRVRWTSSGHHTVTAYRGQWSKNTVIGSGRATAFTFRRAGLYRYYCVYHATLHPDGTCSGMCGTVRVR